MWAENKKIAYVKKLKLIKVAGLIIIIIIVVIN